MINKNLAIKLGNWTLDNPIIPASGTFGYGYEHQRFYDINILGSFSMKGTTLEPRFGNPLPRIAECESGLINSIGLQNPGIDVVIKKELVELKKIYNKKIIANISGYKIEEYLQCAKQLDQLDIVGIIEVNVSCPNVPTGCHNFAQDPKALFELVKILKQNIIKPIYVKLAPMVNNIVELAIAAQNANADGLVLINTVPGMRIDLKTAKPILANKMGGYSGPGIKPIALRAIYLVYQAVKIPIIGSGGVMNAHDVIEMMYAGASAVQIGAANLINPFVCQEIINELPKVMKDLNIDNLQNIIGKAHK